MTDCLQCGLSLQGRDNESDTCSDCLLEEALSNNVSKDDMSVSDKGLTDESYSTIEGVIRQTINEPIMTKNKVTYKMVKDIPLRTNRNTLLDPIEMSEELMSHIFNAEFGGELDPNHRFFECYLQLQLLKEKMLKDEEDAVIAIEGDEVKS